MNALTNQIYGLLKWNIYIGAKFLQATNKLQVRWPTDLIGILLQVRFPCNIWMEISQGGWRKNKNQYKTKLQGPGALVLSSKANCLSWTSLSVLPKGTFQIVSVEWVYGRECNSFDHFPKHMKLFTLMTCFI